MENLQPPQPPIPNFPPEQLKTVLDHLKEYCNTCPETPQNPTGGIQVELQRNDQDINKEIYEIMRTEKEDSFFFATFGIAPLYLKNIIVKGKTQEVNLLQWLRKLRPEITVSILPGNTISLFSSFYFNPQEGDYPQNEEDSNYREEIHVAISEYSVQSDPIQFLAALLHEVGHALQDRLEINKPLNDPANPLTDEERYMVIQSERNATDFAIEVARKLEELLGFSEEYGLSSNIQEILEAKLNNYQEGLFSNESNSNNEPEDWTIRQYIGYLAMKAGEIISRMIRW